MEVIFSNPKYLWLLVSLFGLVLTHNISIGWNRKKALKFANFDAITKATRQTFFPRSYTLLILRSFILIMLIFSVAGIGIWYDGKVSNSDYMLLIDTSGSMLSDDYEPNRLEVAKEAAIEFVDLLDVQANVGVISFAGTSFINQPLTNDKGTIKEAISSIEIIEVGGTSIGDAIILASNVFKIYDDTTRARNIILLTDGQNNIGAEVEDAIKYAAENGVIVNTLGIGSEEGGEFIEGLIVSRLDETTLQSISEQTGGDFYLVNDESELKESYLLFLESDNGRVFFDGRVYLLVLALIILLGEWILANIRYKTMI